MMLLNTTEVTLQLALLPHWTPQENTIVREFSFVDFVAAMAFVNKVAGEAENAAHHPNIDIRWNKVRLALSSHDAGGLTGKDFRLAAIIDSLA